MNTFLGLPAHPLLVHLPVVLLPLTAVGVVLLVARRAWCERYRWVVLGIGVIGTVGAILAAQSGEGLEEQLRAKEGTAAVQAIHDHTEAGDLARTVAIVFLAALAAYVVIPWLLERSARRAAGHETSSPGREGQAKATPRWLRVVLSLIVIAAASASTVTVIEAGHSGASRAWEEFATHGSAGG